MQAELQSRRDAEVSASAAQPPEKLGVVIRAARTTVPSGVTTSAATRLSHVRPCCAVRWPMPPPKVSPATPVVPTTPPGVTSPKACVAESKSSHVAPPWERAILASPSTSTLRMSERSITSPPSRTQWPAGLCPPPRTATSSPCTRAKSKAVATSLGPKQRTIAAGRRSTRALNERRASSYPASVGAMTAPATDRRNAVKPSAAGTIDWTSRFMASLLSSATPALHYVGASRVAEGCPFRGLRHSPPPHPRAHLVLT